MEPKAACTICGKSLNARSEAFAVTQTLSDDRLRIYHWNLLRARSGVHGACCAYHVRELVIHWMITGSLNYPFARPIQNWKSRQSQDNSPESKSSAVLATPIGELAVDHDSVSRLLQNNPASLVVILDELNDALQKSLEENSSVTALPDLPGSAIHHI